MTDPKTPTQKLLAELEADMSFENGAKFVKIASDYFAETRKGEGPVSTTLDKATLLARFKEPLPRGMKPLDEVVRRLKTDVMPDVNRLMHPMYLGHQVSAPLATAVWTDVVISAVNNSMAVWEMSPVATVIEEQVIHWMTDVAGLGASASGTFTSGGTEATFTALLAARARLRPNAWEDGWGGGPMPMLVHGEHAHYAVRRAAGAMGLGTRNCVAVGSTPEFKMDPAALALELERLRTEKREVLAVVATAGCTAFGAFDDLETIASICERYGVWLHVDGAHGASALLSEKHRWRCAGISRADSVAWDPHKMMLMPLSAGMVLVRDGKDLERAFSQKAPYLFHGPDSETELSPDLGKRSLQCSRRADALKVWVALQRLGVDGVGGLYDHLCGLAEGLSDQIISRDTQLESVHRPESNILCWRRGEGTQAQIDNIRNEYNTSGGGWITATSVHGERLLRVTIMNPRTTLAALSQMLTGTA